MHTSSISTTATGGARGEAHIRGSRDVQGPGRAVEAWGGAAAIPAVGGLVMGNLMFNPSREMEHSIVQSDRLGQRARWGVCL